MVTKGNRICSQRTGALSSWIWSEAVGRDSREITGLKVGIVGLGKSGGMIADAMKFWCGYSLLCP